jgi:hypothetical protein
MRVTENSGRSTLPKSGRRHPYLCRRRCNSVEVRHAVPERDAWHRSSSFQTPAPGLQNPWPPRPARRAGPARRGGRLIVTPELEFGGTHRKQTPEAISNRYKMRRLHSPWRTRSLHPGRISAIRALRPISGFQPQASGLRKPNRESAIRNLRNSNKTRHRGQV